VNLDLEEPPATENTATTDNSSSLEN